MTCLLCGRKELTGLQKFYCSPKCGKKAWKINNPKANLQNSKAGKKKATLKKRDYVRELKSQPCSDCRVSYPPYVMDFDHVRGAKINTIAWLLAHRCNWEKLREELGKCELVCANCHRMRTHGGETNG